VLQLDEFVSSYVVRDVCIHNAEDINKWEHIIEESCYCMVVVVLQQCGLFSLTFVIQNFTIKGLLIPMMKVTVTSACSTLHIQSLFLINTVKMVRNMKCGL
jgi:hypothetical protein